MTSSGSVIDDIEKSRKIATSVGLNLLQHQFDKLVNGMQELSRKTKLKDIYAENFSAVWGRFSSGNSGYAKNINPRKFDEMQTEDNNGDIIRAMRKKMEELNKNNHVMMAEMLEMHKASRESMKSSGMGPFGVDRGCEFPSVRLPAAPLLPSGDGGSHTPPKYGHESEVEQKTPGSGNPNARKKRKDGSDEGDDGR